MTLAVPNLDALVDALDAAFAREVGGKEVADMLEIYAQEHDDWRQLVHWSEGGYTRNEVVRRDSFQLLVLCWGAEQESPIHNHEAQDCWMAVLDGAIEEVRYCRPSDVSPGPLDPQDSDTFQQSQVAYISDDIGLHLVRPAPNTGAAVSLHLYANPYDACSVYCPDTGRLSRKPLSNYSHRGTIL
ncbi:MAG: cysteine dioxygenase [Planctomycetota bacterium]|jgi:cysteine dioxygenase